MAKHERQLRASAVKLAQYLDKGIREGEATAELVDFSVQRVENTAVWLFVYDKYCVRSKSRASLTVQVIGNGDTAYVTAISAGSSADTSHAAEEDFVGAVEYLLDGYRQ